MKFLEAFTFLLFAALVATATPQSARAADVLREGAYGEISYSPCADARLLERISQRFDHQVRNVPGLPYTGILAYLEIRQNRFQPAHEESPIARLYCQAMAELADGSRRTLWYMVEYGQGFAGIGDNVEFCLDGFDRWNVYNSHCRIVK